MITLTKAIETLELSLSGSVEVDEMDLFHAKEVGIEGLKRLQQLREYPGLDVNWQIPGETEEDV
ncbi:hypothetical protein ES708_02364 [subsurface metagenome]